MLSEKTPNAVSPDLHCRDYRLQTESLCKHKQEIATLYCDVMVMLGSGLNPDGLDTPSFAFQKSEQKCQ
ncbi:hypothetical protein NQZ68_012925 [Dissostichus eleginoides]|nr:hypothetical protein NQZ68_012925 [Dissostichus eleginoides]